MNNSLSDNLDQLVACALALSARFPAGTPDAFVASLDYQLSELHHRWLQAARYGEELPLGSLRNACIRIRRRYEALPGAQHDVHIARRRAVREWLESHSPDIPGLHGLRSPVAETYEWLRRLRGDLRSVLARHARLDS